MPPRLQLHRIPIRPPRTGHPRHPPRRGPGPSPSTVELRISDCLQFRGERDSYVRQPQIAGLSASPINIFAETNQCRKAAPVPRGELDLWVVSASTRVSGLTRRLVEVSVRIIGRFVAGVVLSDPARGRLWMTGPRRAGMPGG